MQLAAWSGGAWRHGVPEEITGVSIDSRTLRPGNLFIAVRGPHFDGHDFVSAAFQRGASAAVVARVEPGGNAPGPLLAVDDASLALRRIADGYRRTLAMKVIAVTGSLGKTTVKEMIAAVLSRRFKTARSIGNWNNEYGLPLSILNVERPSEIGVFELGVNHPGELLPLCRLLKPDWGVITGIGPVHLEFFGSERKIAEEKAILLENLPGNSLAFLGCDHPWHDLLRAAGKSRIISLGERGDADYVLLESNDESGEACVLERTSGENFRFQAPLPGRHVARNALFAIAVARASAVSWPEIRAGLGAFRPQPMRWESSIIAGVLAINDAYNANPVSMKAALETFAALRRGGRKWLVLGGMHELGARSEQEHENLGKTVARLSWDGLVSVGPLGDIVAAAARKAGMKKENVFQCENHLAAADVLAEHLKPGDAVLFKASHCERLEKVMEIWRGRGKPSAGGQ